MQAQHAEIAADIIRFEDAITALADAGRDAEIAALLAPRLALDRKLVETLLGSQVEEPTAIICRAAGLSLNGYSAVLRMRRRKLPDRRVAASALLGAYRAVPRAAMPELARLLEASGLQRPD